MRSRVAFTAIIGGLTALALLVMAAFFHAKPIEYLGQASSVISAFCTVASLGLAAYVGVWTIRAAKQSKSTSTPTGSISIGTYLGETHAPTYINSGDGQQINLPESRQR